MVLRVELGKVHVRDAQGMPPNTLFWFGEAPGRTDAVSLAVSRLRENMSAWPVKGVDHATRKLIDECQVSQGIAALSIKQFKVALKINASGFTGDLDNFFNRFSTTMCVNPMPGGQLTRATFIRYRVGV